MIKKVLLIATVQSHIGQFHKPLMRLLKEHGWEVHVAARDNLAEKNGLQLEYPDKVFNIPFQRSPFDPRNLKAYRMLKKILQEEHYDVIHCNTPVGGVFGRLTARKYRKQGTEVFYTAHGFHFYKGAPKKNWLLYYPIEKLLAGCTDKLITINREDYELARARFNCRVERIHGVGANSSRFYPLHEQEQAEQRKALGLSGHILLSVGELLPNKNQRTAILAVKKILPECPDAQLLIAGNGPERENLEQLIEREGLQGHVKLLGYTTKIREYMQVCDALLACSYREGLPMNVVECMLCGKPVIASHNRGHDELVQDGVNGWLTEPDDADGLAECIVDLLKRKPISQETVCGSVVSYKSDNVEKELSTIYPL